MAKVGRKGWNEMSDSQKYKIYQAYSKQYDKRYAKYGGNLEPKYDFQSFKMVYNEYYKINKTNVVRRIVSDSNIISYKQARAVAKEAYSQKYYSSYKEAYKSIIIGDANAAAFWELVKEYGFKEVVYNDN